MYRDYDNNNSNVLKLYKNMHTEQTYQKKIDFSNQLKYNKSFYITDIFPRLNQVVDSSDPDAEFPQIFHGYQTAESIKNNYFINNNLKSIEIKDIFTEDDWNTLPTKYKNLYNTTITQLYDHIKDWKWLILIGLIHDLGKVLVLKEFGNYPEWFSVGDIYPLGCKFSSSNIYYNNDFYKLCPDYNNTLYQSSIGIYKHNCGFDNVEMTFSHDYYLSNILQKSKTNLPYEAIYIIKYHSFYPWHTPNNNIRGYLELASEKDWYYLPLLKLFQQSDLYSKTNIMPNIGSIQDYYNNLINLYIPHKIFF